MRRGCGQKAKVEGRGPGGRGEVGSDRLTLCLRVLVVFSDHETAADGGGSVSGAGEPLPRPGGGGGAPRPGPPAQFGPPDGTADPRPALPPGPPSRTPPPHPAGPPAGGVCRGPGLGGCPAPRAALRRGGGGGATVRIRRGCLSGAGGALWGEPPGFPAGGPGGPWWVETKSVTLVEGGVALFPDAPTLRGQRHLHQLAAQAISGERAAVVFVVQRPDAETFMPHAQADPAFAAALAEAARAGVEVHAFRCAVSPDEIRIVAPIPVSFP